MAGKTKNYTEEFKKQIVLLVKKRKVVEFSVKGVWNIKIQRNEVGERFQ